MHRISLDGATESGKWMAVGKGHWGMGAARKLLTAYPSLKLEPCECNYLVKKLYTIKVFKYIFKISTEDFLK